MEFPRLRRRLVIHVMWFDPEWEWRGKICPVCGGAFQDDPRHYIELTDAATESDGLVAKWRSKERLKTTAVALVMALNIG